MNFTRQYINVAISKVSNKGNFRRMVPLKTYSYKMYVNQYDPRNKRYENTFD